MVALDASEAAHEALSVALELALVGRAQIGICSVVDPVTVAGTAPPSPAMDILIRDVEIEARRLVNEAADRARKADIKADVEVSYGMPVDVLLEYAERFKADLIVMGTHGRRGLQHLLMGSVAEGVLRESKVPVLVLRAARPQTMAA